MTLKCQHFRILESCAHCRELRSKWYTALAAEGFSDIEYGLSHPHFLMHTPDPTQPGAEFEAEFYHQVWSIYHDWVATLRSPRDCRLAELYASQEGDTGTVRGIARVLRQEGLAPWSPMLVHRTLREIQCLICSTPAP